MAGFKFYHYDPSFAAAVIFIALFTLATGRHLQLLVKNRSWYFIPFILGCLCKLPREIIVHIRAELTVIVAL